MATRTEKVVLTLDTKGFEGPAGRAAARTEALKRELDGLGTSAGRAGSPMQGLTLDVARGTTAFRRGASDIDLYSGRLKLMTQAGLALGPALVPAIAGLVPAVTGLASGMAGAAGAAAAAGLAFAGVGDALGALNDFQLEPSAENFQKLQQAMDDLGPAGANFVRYLDSIGGELEALQQVAGQNMFPGMTAGLQSLMGLMPRVQDLIGDLSARMGGLAADAGKALAGEEWEAFFSFLKTDAAPIFEEFSRAAGNVALGLGNLMVAFAPLSRDFSSGLLEASRAFAAWSADSSNFTEFIDYIRQVGPQAAEFFLALADAAVALAQAVAPWGSVVLPAMTALANVFTAIAGSPIGPALTTAALAMLTFNKAAAAGAAVMGRVGPAVGGARSGLGQMKADLGTVATTWATAGAATERESKKMAAATGRLKTSMASVGKGAALVGAVGIAASGAADGIGLQNTAMLGLTGTMAGPWGAAAGAAIGLVLDFKAAQAEAAASAKDFAATLDSQTGSITESSKAFVASKLDADQINKMRDLGLNIGEVSEALAGGSKTWDAYYDSLDSTQKAMLRTRESFFDWSPLINDLDSVAAASDDGVTAFEAQADAVDSTAAAASAAVTSFQELTAAQQASTQAALAGIDAGTAFGAALDKAKDQAAAGTEGLNKYTEAGRANRTALSQLIGSYNAQDAATKNSVQGYERVRRELAEIGRGMGLSAEQIRAWQARIEKPTALVVNTEAARAALRGAMTAYKSLPANVQTELQTKGVPKTNAQVDALVRKYKLTEAQRTALITLKDLASAGISNVISRLRAADGQTALVTMYTDQVTRRRVIDYGVTKMKGLEPGVNANGGLYNNGVRQFADGGFGTNGRYYSRQPQIIPGGANILWGEKETGWEAYISGKPSEKDRNLEILALAAQRLGATVLPAAAGRITAYANGGGKGPWVRAEGFGGIRHTERGWQEVAKRMDRLGDRLDRTGNRIEKSMKSHEKAIDRTKAALDTWNQRHDQLKSAVTGSLTRDWQGGDAGGVWSSDTKSGTAAFAQQQWKQQASDAKALAATIANLRKNGAGDAFIAEILNSQDPLAAAKMFNQQSKAGMLHSQKLFLDATRATSSAANSTSAIYADEQRKATIELAGLNKQMAALQKQLDRNHKQAEATRKKESAAAAASKGARDRR